MNRTDIDRAFTTLCRAIAGVILPTKDGSGRSAYHDEFMLMDAVGEWLRFKHSGSRNYLMVHKRTLELNIPTTGEPFLMGTFDIDE